jgi:crossover junction endodeoxyribonuclease RusA
MTITFILPWPSADLSPNARLHWARKAKAAKKARSAAWAHAVEAKVHRINADKLSVKMMFCPPDNRRRDLDNTISATKPQQDGIADAVGIDDSKWAVTYSWGDVVPGGAVFVQLEAMQ